MGQLIKDKDIWDREVGELIVDRGLTQTLADRQRGSVRISLGLFYTKEEYEAKRKEILKKPLP